MTLFSGQEALASHFMRDLKESLGKGREVVELSDPSPVELRQSLCSGLFSPSKVVFLRDLSALKFDWQEIFSTFLKSDSDIFFISFLPSRSVGKKSVKSLESLGCRIALYPQPENYASRREMVGKLFQKLGKKVSPAAVELLEGNVRDCSSLVEFCFQLSSSLPDAELTLESVQSATGFSLRTSAFKVAERAFKGDAGAVEGLKDALEEEEPLAVIGALAYKFRSACQGGGCALSPQAWSDAFGKLSEAAFALTTSEAQKGIGLIYEAVERVCMERKWKS